MLKEPFGINGLIFVVEISKNTIGYNRIDTITRCRNERAEQIITSIADRIRNPITWTSELSKNNIVKE